MLDLRLNSTLHLGCGQICIIQPKSAVTQFQSITSVWQVLEMFHNSTDKLLLCQVIKIPSVPLVQVNI